MQKNETGLLSLSLTKTNSKLIEDLDIRTAAVKHLENNIINLSGIDLGINFLDIIESIFIISPKYMFINDWEP